MTCQSVQTEILPKVSNVKIRLKLDAPVTIPKHLSDKTVFHNNFISLRIDSLSCIIFHKSGHVNISGIKDFSHIKEALVCFNKHFESNIDENNIIVDNSTASGRLSNYSICLPKLANISPHHQELVTVSIRQYFFPSAVIRPRRRQQQQHTAALDAKLATVVLFANGKFNIVGGKSERSISQTWNLLRAITDGQ